jgi:hypothetical protein
VLHYNKRVTGARDAATHLVEQIRRKGIDYNNSVGTNVAFDYSQGPEYDKQELNLFMFILIVSVLLPLLVALLCCCKLNPTNQWS